MLTLYQKSESGILSRATRFFRDPEGEWLRAKRHYGSDRVTAKSDFVSLFDERRSVLKSFSRDSLPTAAPSGSPRPGIRRGREAEVPNARRDERGRRPLLRTASRQHKL